MGFIDENNDGVNDQFVDANGDGICDLTGIPFSHGLGFIDADGDGINDLDSAAVNGYGHMASHIDADGNGIDDETGIAFRQCFGWVDLNDDGINDVYTDHNGDFVNDVTFEEYHHGFTHNEGMGMSQLPSDYQWPHMGHQGR